MKASNNNTPPPLRVALFSTPWPLFNRPSIQLGVLKAFCQQHGPGASIQAHHMYLPLAERIGYPVYRELSEQSWLAESVFAGLLYPERRGRIQRFFYKQAAGRPHCRRIGYHHLVESTGDFCREYMEAFNWEELDLAGFSVSICQLTSSLYFLEEIKKRRASLPVVFGGSMMAGESGLDLFRRFNLIDYLVQGEGEQPLVHLIEKLMPIDGLTNHAPDPNPAPAPGLWTRSDLIRDTEQKPAPLSGQLGDLTLLPKPDYDEYFDTLKSLKPQSVFFPQLPVEASRGCWWSGSRDRGCAFCNLNRQWRGYRTKKPDQVRAEIDALTDRHQVLHISFVDNVLPTNQSDAFYLALQGLNKDLSMFGEARASTATGILKDMKNAGFREIQIGIEALATGLLKKMNKGVRAIDNVEIMKNCEELGLVGNSNLMIRFPGSNESEVEETLRYLDFVKPFQPLKIVRFHLGLGSPVWRNPNAFGLTAVSNHPHYRILFPESIVNDVRFMIQGYRGDIGRQEALWRPVVRKVKAWEKGYNALHGRPDSSPILGYRDGGGFMIIRQRLIDAEPMNHRLTGASREIYLYCRRTRSIEDIINQFPKIPERSIRVFLDMMTDKRLMFSEDDHFLSLAVSVVERE